MSNTQSLSDRIPLRGDLRINVIPARVYEDALRYGDISDIAKAAAAREIELVRRIDIRNKITFLAADVLVNLLAQRVVDGPPSYSQIYTIRMGTSTTAPERSDTNLGNPKIGKILDNVAGKISPLAGELQFLATLQAADGNGNTFSEAGLFTKGDEVAAPDNSGFPTPGVATDGTNARLFARQIHPPLPKANNLVFQYDWRIAFTFTV